MHLQNLHLFCQDDGKPEGLLQRRRMCWYFFCSCQTLTVNGSSMCVHQGGWERSTDLIAPRDSSQAGGLSRLATLLPLNVRSVYGEGISKPAQATAGGQFSVTCSNTASSQACAQTRSFIHPCFSSRGRKKW